LFDRRNVGKVDCYVIRHENHLAGGSDTVSETNFDSTRAFAREHQPGNHTHSARTSQVREARKHIFLVADLVLGGQETPIKISGTAPALVDDDGSAGLKGSQLVRT
jgi:hypothetical protein